MCESASLQIIRYRPSSEVRPVLSVHPALYLWARRSDMAVVGTALATKVMLWACAARSHANCSLGAGDLMSQAAAPGLEYHQYQ